jgi:peptidoglycan/LPS O-acetylase OafA/YrhL
METEMPLADLERRTRGGQRKDCKALFTGGLAIVNGEVSADSGMKRYPILDALRFVFAFWVVMDHFGPFPLFANADTSVPAVWLLSHTYPTLVCGIGAVMGFFVISGFCIHLPFRNGKALAVARF